MCLIIIIIIIAKKPKSLLEKYCQEVNKNNLDVNLAYLKKISRPVANYELIRSALDSNKLQAKKSIKKDDDEASVFTEEDFKNFEKSYFNKKN